MVAALRLVCGGSASASRALRTRHPADLGPGQGTSAVLSPVGHLDPDRPSILAGHHMLEEARTACRQLTHNTVRADRPLNTAIRQIVAAGSRGLVQDRLLNLVTAAEALFLQRTRSPRSTPTGRKAAPMAQEAARQLAGDRILDSPDAAHISQLMRDAYRWRNAEVHGDEPATGPMHDLAGAVTDLPALATDLERLVRRAAVKALAEAGR
ncbi:hypothetical protein [Streptomyces phaeochromogenes]|uniref:hypothetical protein n=1 Tax=Streptomyces phaeochromogenes TaxID=1923 RepID=UPI0027D8DDA0|nr:hypothetical protein [Streptomyces phaeochromogenes]